MYKKGLSALILGMCTSFSFSASSLVYCSEASPEAFDPAQVTTGSSFDAASYAIHDRLIHFEQGTTKLVPALAQRWEVSADGLTYTFFLRKNVAFHSTPYFKPTRTMNADDVVFSFQRMIDSNHPFRKAYPIEIPYAADTGIGSNIKNVIKVDEHTVKIVLKEVDAPFLSKIAMPFAVILSQEYAYQLIKQGKASQIKWNPVGTGPFILKSYQKDAQIRYTANKMYWDSSAVMVDQLVFAITTDPSVRVQKLKRNECHIMSYPRPSDVSVLKKDPQLKVVEAEGFNVGYLAYNTQQKILSNRQVRQALDMAIDKNTIIKSVYQGMGVTAKTALPPSLWAYPKTMKDSAYDSTQAKKLLTQAGYPNGFNITLWAMPVQRPYNPNAKQMAELIQQDWKKIGVNATIMTYEWGEYLKRVKNGEHGAALLGWNGDFADPDNFLGGLLTCEAAKSGNNYAKWCHPDFDALVLKARRTINVSEREKMYLKAQEIFKREIPWTPIAHSITVQPMRREVEGFKISPFSDYTFTRVYTRK
jgi:dipeptide transport system substrate-binding protein